MENYGLCLNGLYLAGQGTMHLAFAGRLTGRRLKIWHVPAYVSLLCAIELLSGRLAVPGILSIGAGVLALHGVSRLILGNPGPVSWAAAVLAFYISQLSFGIINSVEAVLFPRLIGSPALYVALLAAMASFFALCAAVYAAVLRLLSLREGAPYMGLLLFPGLFFFAAELYILRTSYSFCAASLPLEDAGKHSALLFLQVMGLAALLCTLYAYSHLCRGFQAQAALQSLTQAARTQRVYIAEARARYEQTRAFRHDVKNHLSVLDGLLSGGKLEEGRAYLKKLETASEALSFPYQTGNPVVDILLGEKLGLAAANGVETEVSLRLPTPCAIDDFDLCVIFANALDNAIHACRTGQEPPSIRVAGRRQGDFYLLEFENTCSGGPLPPAGTGLANIRSVAEKYRGAVLTEKEEGRFSLNVLLNIS